MLLTLGACSTGSKRPDINITTSIDGCLAQPPITLADMNLRYPEYDMPRDLSQPVNVKTGKHPIMLNSNVYIGFTREEWDKLIVNFATLKANNIKNKKIINNINEQNLKCSEKKKEETTDVSGQDK